MCETTSRSYVVLVICIDSAAEFSVAAFIDICLFGY